MRKYVFRKTKKCIRKKTHTKKKKQRRRKSIRKNKHSVKLRKYKKHRKYRKFIKYRGGGKGNNLNKNTEVVDGKTYKDLDIKDPVVLEAVPNPQESAKLEEKIVGYAEKLQDELITKIGGEYEQPGIWKRKRVFASPIGSPLATCLYKVGMSGVGNWIQKKSDSSQEKIYIFDKDLPIYLEAVVKLFAEYGLYTIDDYTNPSNFNVEIHYANASSDPLGSGLTVHPDNNGAISGKLHTLIVYLETDCVGGDLGIFPNDASSNSELPLYTLNVRPTDETDKNKKKIVLFNGGLFHKPFPITKGNTSGKRVIVSFQIRQRSLKNKPPSGGASPDDKPLPMCEKWEDDVTKIEQY